ncbi:MAG TPA: ParB/RepB/Spo0J family partition protein [Phycisphaeraceae bacterium]
MDQVVEIPLERLEAHGFNSNVMPARRLAKLMGHIQRTGRYPPLIVRPMKGEDSPADEGNRGASSSAENTPRFQILDGHHRVQVLRRLGHARARCVVWEVDDREALMLLATLNRLEGHDDVRRRAALVAELGSKMSLKDLPASLPEEAAQLQKLLATHQPPPAPRLPMESESRPVAVHFFLPPQERRELEACLKRIGGRREEALMKLVAHAQSRMPLTDTSS